MSILEQVKWEEIYPDAEAIFRRLLQFETVNPPGNEKPAAEFLAEILRQEGLEPELIESAPGRANLICRLKGTGEKPPCQLDGHLDVVGVEEEFWTHPPFAADVADGYIWGRGTLDMKQMVTMSLVTLILMKRLGANFKRDLIFTAVADEESGCDYGAKFLVDNHPDKIKAEYCIGEIGGFSMVQMGKTFYPVQVAEKGRCWFELVAKGDPGHGSIPDPNAAPVKLSDAVVKLVRKGLPQHNTAVMEGFISTLSSNYPFPNSLVLKLLLRPALSRFILEKLFPDKTLATTFHAMLHNTANPTVIRAGEKTNVIPSIARVEVDGRILPGQNPAEFIAEVKDLIGEDFEINILSKCPPSASDPDDPVMDMIAGIIQRHDPGAIVLPNLLTGFSDGSQYSRLGTKYFGFSPMKLNPEDSFKTMAHGHNEKIPVEGFRFGIRVLPELIEELCS
jgi:acetylornithine deacetylase/succinyl-diaminopimelate desuccinylase-like protein